MNSIFAFDSCFVWQVEYVYSIRDVSNEKKCRKIPDTDWYHGEREHEERQDIIRFIFVVFEE